MIFFTERQVMAIHAGLVEATGGMNGLRDAGLLDSALKAPFQTFGGVSLYPGLYDKAARLCHSLVENHPFADGNKRTGVHLALLFLQINGEKLVYSQTELSDFGFAVASGSLSMEGVKDWLIGKTAPAS